MAYHVFVPPGNNSRLIIRSKTVSFKQRVTWWRSLDKTGVQQLDTPKKRDASAPDTIIADVSFAPHPKGYFVQMLFTRVYGEGASESEAEWSMPNADTIADGVGAHVVLYNDMVSFDLSWAISALNFIRVFLERVDATRLTDPNYQHRDEVFCEVQASYPRNIHLRGYKRTFALGRFREGNKRRFKGEGLLLFEGRIADELRMEIGFWDADTASGIDRLGALRLTASKEDPVAGYQNGQNSRVLDVRRHQTLSTSETSLLRGGASYVIYVKCVSSRQPVGFLSVSPPVWVLPALAGFGAAAAAAWVQRKLAAAKPRAQRVAVELPRRDPDE